MLPIVLTMALPLWCILSSRSTLYFVLYMALNNFITLPSPRSISWWAVLKALFVYWFAPGSFSVARKAFHDRLVPRLRFGFRDKEVIFRKPYPGSNPSVNRLIESLPCVADPVFLMMGVNADFGVWIFDYAATNEATAGLRSGAFEEDTWKTAVWVKDDLQGWVAHEIWRHVEIVCDPGYPALFKVPHVSRPAISQ
jgi:hypothetical protein